MNKDLRYRVTCKDGTIHENLTYMEAFDLITSTPWDLINFMNPEEYDWRKDHE